MARLGFIGSTVAALALGGCVTTSMQGYADRQAPDHPIRHIVALVNAPLPLATSFQASLASEAAKRSIAIDDARAVFPPTRQYADAVVRSDLKARGVDAVLIVDAGDSGVTREYAGTLFNGQSSSSTNGLAVANSFGQSSTISYTGQTTQNAFAVATPMYHYSRQTTFSAKLVDPTTGRNLSIGNGQINAGGRFFVGDGTSGGSSAAAIFSDLQSKGIISRSS